MHRLFVAKTIFLWLGFSAGLNIKKTENENNLINDIDNGYHLQLELPDYFEVNLI